MQAISAPTTRRNGVNGRGRAVAITPGQQLPEEDVAGPVAINRGRSIRNGRAVVSTVGGGAAVSAVGAPEQQMSRQVSVCLCCHGAYIDVIACGCHINLTALHTAVLRVPVLGCIDVFMSWFLECNDAWMQ